MNHIFRFCSSVPVFLNNKSQSINSCSLFTPFPSCPSPQSIPKSSTPHLAISMCCRCPLLSDPSPVHCKLQHYPPAYHPSLGGGKLHVLPALLCCHELHAEKVFKVGELNDRRQFFVIKLKVSLWRKMSRKIWKLCLLD